MSLLKADPVYKPFNYPWCYDAWLLQQQIHWLPEEVPLAEDIKDWRDNLSDGERNLLTQIFRFFTQSDIEVNNCYMRNYARVFQPTEVAMMLTAFSNMETIHIAAYAHLLDTIGMPETEYKAFLHYKEMRDKYNFLQQWGVESKEGIAKTLAVFGAFTEGLQLFASFAILLNFPRFNKMKGMGQIVTWSARDETLHCNSLIQLYKTFLAENPEIDVAEIQSDLGEACEDILTLEDAFIDLAFNAGEVEGLTANAVKQYIRYIANLRLTQLEMKPKFVSPSGSPIGNPLPWIDTMLNAVEHANFFENRSTEYSKAATRGDWDSAFS